LSSVSSGIYFRCRKRGNYSQRIGICDGRILAFRHAGTEADFYFIVEDNICPLIINVTPELKLNKDLLPIASTSSPAIANTFVVRSYLLN
jgi:hypothetical protein